MPDHKHLETISYIDILRKIIDVYVYKKIWEFKVMKWNHKY